MGGRRLDVPVQMNAEGDCLLTVYDLKIEEYFSRVMHST